MCLCVIYLLVCVCVSVYYIFVGVCVSSCSFNTVTCTGGGLVCSSSCLHVGCVTRRTPEVGRVDR